MAAQQHPGGGSEVYRRAPRIAFRAFRGSVDLEGPGGLTRSLGGAAAVVWIALEEPASADELLATIRALGGELAHADPATLDEALVLLVESGVCEVDSP